MADIFRLFYSEMITFILKSRHSFIPNFHYISQCLIYKSGKEYNKFNISYQNYYSLSYNISSIQSDKQDLSIYLSICMSQRITRI